MLQRVVRLWVPITSTAVRRVVPSRRLSGAATPPGGVSEEDGHGVANIPKSFFDKKIEGSAGLPEGWRPPPNPTDWRPVAADSTFDPESKLPAAESGEADGQGPDRGISKDLFGGAMVPGGMSGLGVGGVGNIVDVQGGKLKAEEQEEGQLYTAERAKNVIIASKRFQLATYTHLPGTKHSNDALHADPLAPVRGAYHAESNSVAVLLRPANRSELQHIMNVAKLASASVAAGHIDPAPLIPVFTRIGLLPPTVRIVGDLVIPPAELVADLREALRKHLGPADDLDGELYQLECGGVVYADILNKRTTVSLRDFKTAYVDPTAARRNEAIDIGNTQFFDCLADFCRDFLGVPVEEAYLYTLDRAGFSLLALRDGTDNMWREYRFPFADEVTSVEGFAKVLTTMKEESAKATEDAQKAAMNPPKKQA